MHRSVDNVRGDVQSVSQGNLPLIAGQHAEKFEKQSCAENHRARYRGTCRNQYFLGYRRSQAATEITEY